MTRNLPEKSDVVVELVRTRKLAAAESQQVQRSLDVTWRGHQVPLPVITMPMDQLLLNSETHRIKAQRDFDAKGDRSINEDPWGSEAQEYLASLLAALPIDPSRKDPAFSKLQDDLKTYGQKDPGLITPEGILINGNSRCAALRANGALDMRVAVLPSDWTWIDIALVEVELQMRKDFRREYSFLNLLLALEESVNAAGADNAGKAFRLKRTTVDRNLWILALLQDLVSRSVSPDRTTSLNLRDFEADQGKLEELHRTYSKLYKADPIAAEQLKESRLLAMILQKSKTDLRFIGDSFTQEYLQKTLPTGSLLAKSGPTTFAIPGLDIELETGPALLTDTASLVNEAAQARGQAAHSTDEGRARANVYLADLTKAVDRAIDLAGRDERLKKRKSVAVDKLTAATDILEACISDIAEAKSKNALDEVTLNEALVTLDEVLNRLGKTILRSVEFTSGDGFVWLERCQLPS